MEKLCIAIYVIFNNDNSEKYWEFSENRGAMVITLSGLKIFRNKNTKDSKKDMKLQYRL